MVPVRLRSRHVGPDGALVRRRRLLPTSAEVTLEGAVEATGCARSRWHPPSSTAAAAAHPRCWWCTGAAQGRAKHQLAGARGAWSGCAVTRRPRRHPPLRRTCPPPSPTTLPLPCPPVRTPPLCTWAPPPALTTCWWTLAVRQCTLTVRFAAPTVAPTTSPRPTTPAPRRPPSPWPAPRLAAATLRPSHARTRYVPFHCTMQRAARARVSRAWGVCVGRVGRVRVHACGVPSQRQQQRRPSPHTSPRLPLTPRTHTRTHLPPPPNPPHPTHPTRTPPRQASFTPTPCGCAPRAPPRA